MPFLSSAVHGMDVWVELRAPRYVIHRNSAALRCEHNTDPALIYKVAYFRGGSRILQYVWGRVPPYERYNFTGAEIDAPYKILDRRQLGLQEKSVLFFKRLTTYYRFQELTAFCGCGCKWPTVTICFPMVGMIVCHL
ncbi:hypothetical protein EVAR_98489_1 [Eumeta japonica]|uniref:Uncharacterized protein n=1 Tax=Eumeta variegata TaxID=151549 RepID=A0A4C1YIJ0_EUMVA|nr:hypothetical protein EVAR_98489_1 [Eumeta japonica]